VGITGRFWTLAAEIVRISPEHFREPLPAGLAQAAWNFELTAMPEGVELATETRVSYALFFGRSSGRRSSRSCVTAERTVSVISRSCRNAAITVSACLVWNSSVLACVTA